MASSEIQYDFSTLATSYLGFFVDSETLLTFLNTTQTGLAHTASGTDFSVLMKHLLVSLCICLLEILCFSYLRIYLKNLYQPLVFLSINADDVARQSVFGWLIPTWRKNTNDYMRSGLDSYFFIRFIDLLLFYFSTCGILNFAILVPINFSGNSTTHFATGLDKLSLSNIALSKANRLNAHFVCTLVSVAFFHWALFREMQNIFEIRQVYLTSMSHKLKELSRILLVGDVPEAYRNIDKLQSLFKFFSGGLEEVWFTDDYTKYERQTEKAQDALDTFEEAQIRFLQKKIKLKDSSNKKKQESILRLWPSIFFPLVKVPLLERRVSIRLPGIFRVFLFQKKIPILEFCVQTLADTNDILLQRLQDIKLGDFDKKEKVILKFRSQESMHMAHQTLLSKEIWSFNHSLTKVHPDDIMWDNVIRKSTFFTSVERYFICVISILAIALYIIPVSLITLLSQIPVIIKLFPFMIWLASTPKQVREVLSSLLPAILLSILTECQLQIFQILVHWKGKWSGSEKELDLQQWYFAFLFIQHFLVVSILSSLIVVVVQAVEKPASIPIMLAANVPKSATFFFKYLAVKAFAMCGGSFLQISRLTKHWLYYPFVDTTPRLKQKRLHDLPKISWGSIYPLISVYASIGITYCVISPMISLFMIFIFLLILLYYKYALDEVYSHENPKDTFGMLYPRALFHLYSGIYCLEFCMIGLFFALRNPNGECPMKFQGLVMILVLLFTIFGNVYVHTHFGAHFEHVPVLNECEESDDVYTTSNSDPLLYLHPCYSFDKPQIWLPADKLGEASRIIKRLSVYDKAFSGGTIENAKFTHGGSFILDASNDTLTS